MSPHSSLASESTGELCQYFVQLTAQYWHQIAWNYLSQVRLNNNSYFYFLFFLINSSCIITKSLPFVTNQTVWKTGFSPFELLFGRTPRGVLDLVKESWEEGPSPSKNKVQYVLDLRAKLHTLGQLSRENLLQAQEWQQRLYNRGARLRQFSPGDKVLALLPSSNSKLLAKWQGPFVVTRRVGHVWLWDCAFGQRRGDTNLSPQPP